MIFFLNIYTTKYLSSSSWKCDIVYLHPGKLLEFHHLWVVWTLPYKHEPWLCKKMSSTALVALNSIQNFLKTVGHLKLQNVVKFGKIPEKWKLVWKVGNFIVKLHYKLAMWLLFQRKESWIKVTLRSDDSGYPFKQYTSTR